ncbi:hypothetical protein PRVXH_000399 [Proteinivorax hydrogeniformans]|uniref:Uncharacterized protein n=1 Tax=Proteinivorax hydrogeniformans TaxID=1826727 RepID=A0AAU8HUQ9_9FIRM
MNLQINSIKGKVANSLYRIQMGWTLWYIGILLGIQVIVFYFTSDVQEANFNFMYFISQPSKIYMLVIGIILFFNFFGYFIKNGVTRKDYFVGSAIAAGGVALSIILIGLIISAIIYITGIFPSSLEMDIIDQSLGLVKQITALSLLLYGYYIAGWIVAAGFYGFSGWYKSASIVVAALFAGIINTIWQGDVDFPLYLVYSYSIRRWGLEYTYF